MTDKKTLTVRLSVEDYQQLVEASWLLRLSRSELIRQAITEFISSDRD